MSARLFVGIIEFIVLLLSLSVHESAHAWTADKLGDPTARFLGRVSLNPIVHIDPFGTILLPLIGLYSGFMFGWAKPVPVSVNRLRNPSRDYMLVAAAGPLSNILLAVLLFGVLIVVKQSSLHAAYIVRDVASLNVPQEAGAIVPLVMVAFYGIVINIILAVFNFIPIEQLDGAGVFSGLLPGPVSSFLHSIQSYGFYILLVLVFLGIPAYFYNPMISLIQSILTA